MRLRRRSFTLMELVITIIIVAILASIAMPKFGRVVERSRMSEAVSTLGAMRRSLLRYAVEYRAYTDDFTYLDINITLETPTKATTKYFEYALDPDGAIYVDAVDETLVMATRNGESVGGSYDSDYSIIISESGNFSTGGNAPPSPQ